MKFSDLLLAIPICFLLACNPSDSSEDAIISSSSSLEGSSEKQEALSLENSSSSQIDLSSEFKNSSVSLSSQSVLSSIGSSSISSGKIEGWTMESHDKSANANYALIFPKNEVQELIIHLHKDTLDTMIYRADPDFEPFQMPLAKSRITTEQAPVMSRDYEHQYHHCDVEYNGKKWRNVGVKLKGNATLSTSFVWRIYKMPFKLKFDAFEDDFPETLDQRFYGIKKLGFNNHIADNSQLRERLAAEVMRDFGVPAPRITHYNLKVNNGTEVLDFGLYSIVEYIGSEYLKAEFVESGGNLYKPGDGSEKVAWKSGISLNQDNFEKKTNESSDWSEIEGVISALHATPNLTSAWRAQLESVFNVDGFLKWLAANTAISNWDTYGGADHNYYVYQNPTDSKVNWIAWDLNESFKSDARVANPNLSNVSKADWPLIGILKEDLEYQKVYEAYLKDFQQNHLAQLSARVDAMASQIRPILAKEKFPYSTLGMVSSFDTEITSLKSFISQRNQEIKQAFPLFP
jgi:spore coat protein H